MRICTIGRRLLVATAVLTGSLVGLSTAVAAPPCDGKLIPCESYGCRLEVYVCKQCSTVHTGVSVGTAGGDRARFKSPRTPCGRLTWSWAVGGACTPGACYRDDIRETCGGFHAGRPCN